MSDLLPAVQAIDFPSQRDLLVRARHEVRTAPELGAGQAAEQARMVREWLKVVKGSADLALEATRLECEALRRLAQLGAEPRGIKGGAARCFAAMTEDEFDDILRGCKPWSGALGVYRQVTSDRNDEEARDIGRRIGGGDPADHIPLAPDDLRHLANAASALLGNLSSKGVPFSVSEAAEAIGTEWGGAGWCREPIVREGLREIVRQAIYLDGHSDESRADDRHPAWITYRDDPAGWVRVPWSTASLDQLRFMVELRETQAANAAAVATGLRTVLAELLAAKRSRPDLARCADLWRVAAEGRTDVRRAS